MAGPEDFYENLHVNSDLISINFTQYTHDEAHDMLYAANSELIKNYYANKLDISLSAARKLYDGDTGFRGFRNV